MHIHTWTKQTRQALLSEICKNVFCKILSLKWKQGEDHTNPYKSFLKINISSKAITYLLLWIKLLCLKIQQTSLSVHLLSKDDQSD